VCRNTRPALACGTFCGKCQPIGGGEEVPLSIPYSEARYERIIVIGIGNVVATAITKVAYHPRLYSPAPLSPPPPPRPPLPALSPTSTSTLTSSNDSSASSSSRWRCRETSPGDERTPGPSPLVCLGSVRRAAILAPDARAGYHARRVPLAPLDQAHSASFRRCLVAFAPHSAPGGAAFVLKLFYFDLSPHQDPQDQMTHAMRISRHRSFLW